jgi:radical SAM superfamily enzyme YgiQ (UPF0313 family)
MNDLSRGDVVLFSPHLSREEYRPATYFAVPPLSHLALAGPVRDAGWRVHIIDSKWDLDWRDRVRAFASTLVAFGITSITGYSVRDGMEAAEFIREIRPDVPIVWGGWHPTFAAGQAIADEKHVDYVVRGQGERTFVELLEALEARTPLHGIQGLTFREGDEVVSTPDRVPEDLNHFPPPAYELIDPRRYIGSVGGTRLGGAIYSRGCPYACDFCLDSRQKLLTVSIDRVIADLQYWVDQGADYVRIYDGNFFVSTARLKELCNAIFDSPIHGRFQWSATGVGSRIASLDDELLAMLRQSGLHQVAIGAESGSEELIHRITNKTTVANTEEAVRRLTRHGIGQYLFFIVGYPEEPESALDDTLSFIVKLKKINPDLGVFLNFCIPLPGSEMFELAVRHGQIEPPRTFADWWTLDQTRPNMNHLSPAYAERVRRFLGYLSIGFPPPAPQSRKREILSRAMRPLRSIAQWRLGRQNYQWPVELGLLDKLHSAQRMLQ